MDHLAEAKRLAIRAGQRDGIEEDYFSTQLATAHATIALVELLAERLPPVTETASARQARLREEEKE